MNQPSHSSTPVTPDAHGPAPGGPCGTARCYLRGRCQTWRERGRCLVDAAGRCGRLLFQVRLHIYLNHLPPPPPPTSSTPSFRCRPHRSRCSPRRRCSRRPPAEDGAGGWWTRTRTSADGSSWRGTGRRPRDADRREKSG